MLGKKRITGVDIVVLNTIRAVLAKAQEKLGCGGDLLDISELTIKTLNCGVCQGMDTFIVQIDVNLSWVHYRPAINVFGGVDRVSSPRGQWKPYPVWWVEYGTERVAVQVPQ